mgnify:CR=1 FL=1
MKAAKEAEREAAKAAKEAEKAEKEAAKKAAGKAKVKPAAPKLVPLAKRGTEWQAPVGAEEEQEVQAAQMPFSQSQIYAA